MADEVWKGVQPLVIGHFEPLLLNKFFDPGTPSMRKGRDGEDQEWYPRDQEWYPQDQEWYPRDQEWYPRDQKWYTRDQEWYTQGSGMVYTRK